MHNPPRILVVDDNAGMAQGVFRLLQKEGYEVFVAESGQSALRLASEHLPDLVLLDIRMPGMDGLEVVTALKENRSTESCFVVHLSAERGSNMVKAGLDAGGDGFISLPVANAELTARVHGFLRHKRTLDQLRESEARYRTLFASNPQPMWIFEEATAQLIDVNQAAIDFYGYSREEFLSLNLQQIVLRSDSLPMGENAGGNTRFIQKHKMRNGQRLDVEVTQHFLFWGNTAAVACLLTDVTERKIIEAERERLLHKYQNEISEMQQPGENPENQLAGSFKKRLPQTFERLSDQYQTVLNRALDNRIYKVRNEVSPSLRRISMELSQNSASPRDVVDLHCATLERVSPDLRDARAQGFVEVGRMTVLELMGNLVSDYRQQLLEKAV